MKLRNLDAILRALRANLAKLNDCIEALATEVHAAKAERDPFGAMLFAARKSYRRESPPARRPWTPASPALLAKVPYPPGP